MNDAVLARQADAADDPVTAIRHFEAGLESSSLSVHDYLDLAVLYLECYDFGFAAYHHLPIDLTGRAGPRAVEVLDAAARLYPRNTDVQFWQSYVPWRLWGRPIDDNAIRALARRGDSLTPYLYLVMVDLHTEDRVQAARLLEAVKGGRSARERFIKSVVASALETPSLS